MNAKLSNPKLEKVFLAIRPNLLFGLEDQHVTLRYYKSVTWNGLMKACETFEQMLPATIQYDTPHVWRSGTETFHGILVEALDSTLFDHLSMPHLTVPKEYFFASNHLPTHNTTDIVDTLWLGKKINGKLQYTPYKVDQLEVEGSFL